MPFPIQRKSCFALLVILLLSSACQAAPAQPSTIERNTLRFTVPLPEGTSLSNWSPGFALAPDGFSFVIALDSPDRDADLHRRIDDELIGDVAAERQEAAVREVDDAGQVEDQRQAEGHQGVERADDQAVEDVKKDQLQHL